VEVIQPALAFRGIPKAIFSTGNSQGYPRGDLLKKTPGMETFSTLSATNMPAGVMQVWFRTTGGASLRNRMLLLLRMPLCPWGQMRQEEALYVLSGGAPQVSPLPAHRKVWNWIAAARATVSR
jgi:hypothetical protein